MSLRHEDPCKRASYFRVVLHGTGIVFKEFDGDEEPAIGFYTSRVVRAGSAEEAVEKAKRSVLELWMTEEYVRANAGGPPRLSTKSIDEISFSAARKAPNEGHIFYTEE
jgi:hypothetical protein